MRIYQVRGPGRVFAALVSLPFWAAAVFTAWSVYLGDPLPGVIELLGLVGFLFCITWVAVIGKVPIK